MGIKFEWDEAKAESNFAKHKVSFGEAATVFGDQLSRTIADPQHSDEEDRFVIIGSSSSQRLLVVIHTERTDSVRIISARPATKHERDNYEQGNEEL